MDFKQFDPIVVTWEDAWTDSTAQAESIEMALKSYDPTYRHSHGLFIGYATNKDRTALVIATEDDRMSDEDESCGGLTFIPKDMVIKLGRPGRKRSKPPTRKKLQDENEVKIPLS